MRVVRTALIVVVGLALAGLTAAPAQSLDAFFGLNGLYANQTVTANPPLGGGLFPSAGANLWLGPVGVGAEGSWRASRSSAGLRPLYYTVDALFSPIHIARSFWPELMVGVGAQTVSSSSGTVHCSTNCSAYNTT
ncbi:MAG: hypothetical protein ACRD1L_03455, partial [Terriglobales bacterium]